GVAPRQPAAEGRELRWLAVERAGGVERRAAARRGVEDRWGCGGGGPRCQEREREQRVGDGGAAGLPAEAAAETDGRSHGSSTVSDAWPCEHAPGAAVP